MSESSLFLFKVHNVTNHWECKMVAYEPYRLLLPQAGTKTTHPTMEGSFSGEQGPGWEHGARATTIDTSGSPLILAAQCEL